MNLEDIVDVVVEETARPDQRDMATRAVRRAITQTHSIAFFGRDLVEDVVTLGDPTLTEFKINMPARSRKIKRIIPLDAAGDPIHITTSDNQYRRIEASGLVDTFYRATSDIYYESGAAIVIRSSTAPAQLYIQWYELPEVADLQLETWLMALHDNIIIDAAKSLVYASLGQNEIGTTLRNQLLQIDYPTLIASYATGDFNAQTNAGG